MKPGIWKIGLVFQILFVIGPACAYVTPSQDACIWGIPSSALTMMSDSMISEASLVLKNIRQDPDCLNPVLYINLLKNAPPGIFQIPDNQVGNLFHNYGSCLKIIDLSDLEQVGQDLVIPLHHLNIPDSWIIEKFDIPYTIDLPNQNTIACSTAILELLDAVGTGSTFGFGIDSDGFTFDIISLEIKKDSFQNPSPSETQLFYFQNIAAPIMLNIPDRQIQPGQLLTFQVFVFDIDQNPVQCTALNLPPGAEFNNNIFRWTPSEDLVGNWDLVFNATDGAMATSKHVQIQVIPLNSPPEFQPIEVLVIEERQQISLPITVQDPDGDPVTVTASNLPIGAEFDGISFQWRPWYEQAGLYTIIFTASDGQATQTLELSITVLPVPLPTWYEDWKNQNNPIIFF